MCLRETAIAGVEPHTAAGGGCEAKKREKAHSTWVVHTLVIPYHKLFQRAENYLKCESLIGVLKERGEEN